MQKFIKYLFFISLLLLTACGQVSVPSDARPEGRLPQIKPDYTDVTLPPNLCPISFGVMEDCSQVVARFSCDGQQIICGDGKVVKAEESAWHQLLANAKGKTVTVEVWGRKADGWVAYQPFSLHIATTDIDPYITYRLIPPSYVTFEELIIEQRDLTSFETRELYNNMKVTTERKGQCINCHSFQNYQTKRWMFHMRKDWGGTVIMDNGRIKQVDLKRPEVLSAGVYPSWHPTENLIAFSTNKTAQVFHTNADSKVEVFDAASDLILYDVETDQIIPVSDREDQLECFPTWSPDGRWLYFTSATIPFDIHAADPTTDAYEHYQEVRYDLCRKSFDPATHQFGDTEMVYEASADSMSVTLPRLSPDGQYIVFAQAPYGCFHVWHPEAEIMALRLEGDSVVSEPQPLTGLNSAESDSYPTFSSNGHWVMTSSRRDDGNYTRPYIAYFNPQSGQCAKAFEVPQTSPAFYDLCIKSFNRPEFTLEPVRETCHDIANRALSCQP